MLRRAIGTNIGHIDIHMYVQIPDGLTDIVNCWGRFAPKIRAWLMACMSPLSIFTRWLMTWFSLLSLFAKWLYHHHDWLACLPCLNFPITNMTGSLFPLSLLRTWLISLSFRLYHKQKTYKLVSLVLITNLTDSLFFFSLLSTWLISLYRLSLFLTWLISFSPLSQFLACLISLSPLSLFLT